MILDQSLKLEAVLAGSVAANQPEVHVDFQDWTSQGQTTPPQPFRVALNGNTDVTILAAPTQASKFREPLKISIYNKDTASVIVTVKTDDGSTERIIIKSTVQTGRSLFWEKEGGWYQSP